MQKSEKYNTRNLYFSQRITNAMRQIPDYPLTIVEAPMGYGKTTAVREQRTIRCSGALMYLVKERANCEKARTNHAYSSDNGDQHWMWQ